MKPRTISRKSAMILIVACAMVLAACGSDADDATESGTDETSTETTATETTAAETTAAETTAAETTAAETTAAETSATEAGEEEEATAAEGVPIDLGEWFISEPGDLTAGTITFSLSNVGENPHAFAIVRGTSYEELPQLENGAVDTDALGDDFLGSTENIDSGGTGSIDFDLEAGDYVFFCPIQFGPNSHAAAGQVLSVTVG